MIPNTKKIAKDKKYCETLFNHYLKKSVIRSSAGTRKHLEKAVQNLEFANFILEEHEFSIKEKLPDKHFYDWCITIYYYALYHTALALVEKLGYESKNHTATITAITLFYYHKDNILKKEDIDFLIQKISIDKKEIEFVLESKGMRERACYGTGETFDLAITKIMQKETAEFVNKIRALLE